MPQPTTGRTKARLYHTKSRNGCATCKKRRIKCDEKHPACTNCTIRQIHCPFSDEAAANGNGNGNSPKGTDAAVQGPSPGTGSNHSDGSPPQQLQPGATDVSVVHLDLFNHFIFEVCPTFTGKPHHDDTYRRLTTRTAFQYPFMLWEILGLAALSRHYASPGDRYYKALATEFQEKSLAGLDDILTKVDSENCLTIVLFAHCIGVHSFCDTFSFAPDVSFPDFLDSLISSAQLLRGINAIFYPFWNDLLATEVGDFIRDAMSRHSIITGLYGDETTSLYTLIQNADISDSSRETYEETIGRLQRDFNELNALDEPQRATTHTAFVWLITSSPAYLQLLGEARPEALVILAYFAVILHHRRSCWAIGNAGYMLLKSIMSHLGKSWKQWLLWPQSEIGRDYPDVAVSPPDTTMIMM